jgi:hypothetical protein
VHHGQERALEGGAISVRHRVANRLDSHVHATRSRCGPHPFFQASQAKRLAVGRSPKRLLGLFSAVTFR